MGHSQSPILGTTITLKRLCKRGYESLLTYYEKVAPHLNEPLYTRPVRTVVRGSPRQSSWRGGLLNCTKPSVVFALAKWIVIDNNLKKGKVWENLNSS